MNKKKTILVTGSKGQLGTELYDRLQKNETYSILCIDKDELDITDEKGVQTYFAASAVDYCINCAAYTDVEAAEKNEDVARILNATAVGILARACKGSGAILFQISTDFVFDGTKTTPYEERDAAHPLGVYGVTKLEGEREALQNNSKTFVIRTAWLYSPHGKNFVKTMMRLGSERESIDVVCDQIGTPTYASDLADALLSIIETCEKTSSPELESLYGTYHFTNDGSASWYEFAKAIMECASLKCSVQPIEAKLFPSAVRRPSFSVLNTSKIRQTFGITPLDWRTRLRVCIARMK